MRPCHLTHQPIHSNDRLPFLELDKTAVSSLLAGTVLAHWLVR